MGEMVKVEITEREIDVNAVLARFSNPGSGCVVSFVGKVRNHDQARQVTRIDYSAHPDALTPLERIAQEAVGRKGVTEVALVHRVGSLEVGDVALLAVAGAEHRGEAFSTVSWMVDAIKEQVPIWKKQHFDDGSSEWSGVEILRRGEALGDVETLAKREAPAESRYAAHIALDGFREEGQKRVREAKVLVVGAGGLGSPLLAYLAAGGIGNIGISDPDTVSLTNLGRQVLHTASRLGQNKAESARETLLALNPEITVIAEPGLAPDNAAEIAGRYDLIVDATDNFAAKYLISDTARKLGIPEVWGTIVGTTFEVSVFDSQEIDLRTIYPDAPPEGSTPVSSEVGVLGPACGQAGALMATEVFKLLTGIGEPLLGRLAIADTRTGSWNVVDYTGFKS